MQPPKFKTSNVFSGYAPVLAPILYWTHRPAAKRIRTV